MARQLCCRGMCRNLLRSDGQQQSYGKAKIPSYLNCGQKNVSETGPCAKNQTPIRISSVKKQLDVWHLKVLTALQIICNSHWTQLPTQPWLWLQGTRLRRREFIPHLRYSLLCERQSDLSTGTTNFHIQKSSETRHIHCRAIMLCCDHTVGRPMWLTKHWGRLPIWTSKDSVGSRK